MKTAKEFREAVAKKIEAQAFIAIADWDAGFMAALESSAAIVRAMPIDEVKDGEDREARMIAAEYWCDRAQTAEAFLETLQAERENARNWPEDFAHENGNYQCICGGCGKMFYGHKRRVTCRVCAYPSAAITLARKESA